MINFGKVITAMITPFDKNLEVNYQKADELAKTLVQKGSDGIVVCGTTGESPTLTTEEKLKLFETVKNAVSDTKAKVIAGTGSNSTADTIKLTKKAEKIGVDGIMLVTPYYNKPPQEALYQHFKSVAESTELPIMIYNVPGRTGRNIESETIIRLSKIDNIVAVKEASGNLDQVSEIRKGTSDDFKIYSGDDNLTLPILAIGGNGVVSVASHIAGLKIKKMINEFEEGNVVAARNLHLELLPIFKGIFITTNPIPIKYILNLLGENVGGYRLPLYEPSEKEKKFLNDLLKLL